MELGTTTTPKYECSWNWVVLQKVHPKDIYDSLCSYRMEWHALALQQRSRHWSFPQDLLRTPASPKNLYLEIVTRMVLADEETAASIADKIFKKES